MKLPWLDLRELALPLAAAMCSYGGPDAQDGENERQGEQQGEHLDHSHKEGVMERVVEVRHSGG